MNTPVSDNGMGSLDKIEEVKSEYNIILDNIICDKGGEPKQYEELMGKIAYHESKGDPYIKQIGGGPGRGLFQFEMGVGRAADLALKRLKTAYSYYNLHLPREFANLKPGYDPSILSIENQKILFLCNYRFHPYSDFFKYVAGRQSITEFWAKYHHTCPDSIKLSNFIRDSKYYEQK